MEPLKQLRAIADRVAASRGLEIWDIQSRREAIGHVVRAEHLAIELTHAVHVADAQNDVIDATNGQHGLRILPELVG